MCHVIAKLQLPSGTFPTSTVPRPENKPGVTGSECERRMFGVVEGTRMALLPLRESGKSAHLDWLLSPASPFSWVGGEALLTQNLLANSNGKLPRALDPEAPLCTRASCPDTSYHSHVI